MRAHVRKIIFFTILIFYSTAPGLCSELPHVETQSIGRLLLPAEWSVASKDGALERNFISDWVLNVQQVLYATAEHPSAELQIFSIWGTSRDGKEKPLPEYILEDSESIAAGLIGERYGSVSDLGGDIVETALANLSVTTYGAGISLTGEGVRYKCASLYSGEKRILVLLKYKPEFEDYWHEHLKTLLNAWVESLTLMPSPAPAIAVAALEAPPPPALPPLPLPMPPLLQGELIAARLEQSPPEEPEQPAFDQSAGAPEILPPEILFSSRSTPAVWLAPFAFFCVFCAIAARRHSRNGKKPAGAGPVLANHTEAAPETETNAVVLPTFEEWLAEKPLVVNRLDSFIPTNAAEGDGFDRVHSLLAQALSAVEGAGSGK